MSAVRLEPTSRDVLAVEQRIPDTHSATKAEHQWHPCPAVHPVLVTGQNAGAVLEHAHALLEATPPRSDTEYRVVLTTTETTTWVLA